MPDPVFQGLLGNIHIMFSNLEITGVLEYIPELFTSEDHKLFNFLKFRMFSVFMALSFWTLYSKPSFSSLSVSDCDTPKVESLENIFHVKSLS